MSSITNRLLSAVLFVGIVAGDPAAQQPRQLAPGVITIIRDATIDDDTSDGPREFSELLSVARPQPWQSNFNPVTQTLLEKAKNVTFQREIWSLEFGFKPLRIVRVAGRDIWYLVYFVRNNGRIRSPQQQSNRYVTLQDVNRPLRFIPTFVLRSHGLDEEYYDRTMPDVVQVIAAKERVGAELHNSRTIGRVVIPVSTPDEDHRVWGVATFDNVNPKADFVSVYVQGLTNAYRWQPPAEGYRRVAKKTGSRAAAARSQHEELDHVATKTLQLNFWRSGDEIQLHEGEIRYGIPLYPDEPARQQDVLQVYQISEPTEYEWIFRAADHGG